MQAALDWVKWIGAQGLGLGQKLWDSWKALWNSPMAWAAVMSVAVAMYSLGHVKGAYGKQALRAQILVATTAKTKAEKAAAEANASIEALKGDLAAANKQLAAARKRAAETASHPVAPAPPVKKSTNWW